jgi:hypothetical protein
MPDRLTTGLVLALAAITVVHGAQAPTLRADTRSLRDTRGGGGLAFTLDSRVLRETRRIDIVLPSGFGLSGPTRRYPVTVVLDGEVSLPLAAAAEDELTQNGQIPESIIVAIENTDRLRDLTPPGLSVSGSGDHQGGDRFLDFIEQELLPAVDRQFRGAAPRVLVGHSSGGVLATYAAATRATYCCVVALDTPIHLGDNWLASRLVERSGRGMGPLRYVSLEARFGWTDETWARLVEAAPSSWQLYRERLALESHESMPLLGMYLGLRQVFRDYSRLAAPEAPTTSILPYYATVGASLGAPVVPPRSLLIQVVDDLLMEGNGRAAREAFTTVVDAYGAPPNAADVLARIADAERRPPPAETVESLLATPFPTPDEAGAFLGDWVGDVWMNPAEVRPGQPHSRLHIAVVDGHVTGETVSEPALGVRLVQKWTYMKVTKDGLSFGYMNGMRPRGVLLHEGILKDGVLSGVLRFGGINVQYPDNMTPPTIRFSYSRGSSTRRP